MSELYEKIKEYDSGKSPGSQTEIIYITTRNKLPGEMMSITEKTVTIINSDISTNEKYRRLKKYE